MDRRASRRAADGGSRRSDDEGNRTREGWTKRQLKEFIVKNAPGQANRRGALTVNDFNVIVAGGPGTWMGSYRSAGGYENSFVTKKIELPLQGSKNQVPALPV